jgi:hypothetical protein
MEHRKKFPRTCKVAQQQRLYSPDQSVIRLPYAGLPDRKGYFDLGAGLPGTNIRRVATGVVGRGFGYEARADKN